MNHDKQPVRYIFDQAWRTGDDRNRAASRDGKIHASTLHECPRQNQLRYRGTLPTDAVPSRPNVRAQIGTAIHEYYLPLLAEQWRGHDDVDDVHYDDAARSTEIVAGPLVAHPDLVVVFTDGSFAIIEVKTGNKALVDAALADEPRRSHLDQCRFAGFLAEHNTGMPMRGYWLYYLDIDDPEQHGALLWRPWTEEQTDAASALVDAALGLTGEATAPRWFGRHASNAFQPFSPCISCEFRAGCLGKDAADSARVEAAAELVDAGYRFGEEVRQAQDELCEFLRLSGIVEKPARYKKYVSDVVSYLGLEEGVTYDVHGVKRQIRFVGGHDRLDEAAAKEMIESLGKKPPMRRVAGHVRFQ